MGLRTRSTTTKRSSTWPSRSPSSSQQTRFKQRILFSYTFLFFIFPLLYFLHLCIFSSFPSLQYQIIFFFFHLKKKNSYIDFCFWQREAAKLKKNSSTSGRATRRGEGGKGRATKEKSTFFYFVAI